MKSGLVFLIIIQATLFSFGQNNVQLSYNQDEVKLMKELIDTVFSRKNIKKRYSAFSENDTIFLLANDTLKVTESWNKTPYTGNYVFIVSRNKNNFPYIFFSSLIINNGIIQVEFNTLPSSIFALGLAKKKRKKLEF